MSDIGSVPALGRVNEWLAAIRVNSRRSSLELSGCWIKRSVPVRCYKHGTRSGMLRKYLDAQSLTFPPPARQNQRYTSIYCSFTLMGAAPWASWESICEWSINCFTPEGLPRLFGITITRRSYLRSVARVKPRGGISSLLKTAQSAG